MISNITKTTLLNFEQGKALFRQYLLVENKKSKYFFLWELVEPLSLAMVFIILFSFKAIDYSYIDIPHALYVVTGIMLWQSLFESIFDGANTITNHKNTLLNTRVQPEAVIWSGILKITYSAFIKYIIVVICAIYFNEYSLLGLFFAFIFFLLISFFFLLVGLFLAPFNVITPDITRVMKLVLRPLMFISCILFPVNHIEMLAYINNYNVFFISVDYFRSIMFDLYSININALMFFLFKFILLSIVSRHIYMSSVKVIIDRT